MVFGNPDMVGYARRLRPMRGMRRHRRRLTHGTSAQGRGGAARQLRGDEDGGANGR